MECMILGGDKRFFYLAEALRKEGHTVYEIKTEEAYLSCRKKKTVPAQPEPETTGAEGEPRLLILPVPAAGSGGKVNGCEDMYLPFVMERIQLFTYVCGGVLPEIVTDACKASGVPFYDFMKDDEVARRNAVATAEGTIMEAFMMSDINIDGSRCLVTGYGRCGGLLAKKLQLLGADVTIAARREEACLQAEKSGFHTILLSGLRQLKRLSSFDYCFNTIPAMVLTRDILEQLRPDVVLIDIASAPGGTEFEVLKERGIQYRHSLGIPGRCSPKTSGGILGDGIRRWLADIQKDRQTGIR